MSDTSHFAEELLKLAFDLKAPPVLTSALGKMTKGVIAKPLTVPKLPTIKSPQVESPKSVPSAGKILGTKIDPARKNPAPPSVYGGTNVH